MYDHDTFFHLSLWGRCGLVVLSLALGGLTIAAAIASFRKVHDLPVVLTLALRALIAIVMFWIFLWLSPQVYYTYYTAIIEDLPYQWVITRPTSWVEIASILFFQNANTLAQISKMAFGWALIFLAFRYQKTN